MVNSYIPYNYFLYLKENGFDLSIEKIEDIIKYNETINPELISIPDLINIYSSLICKNQDEIRRFKRISRNYFFQFDSEIENKKISRHKVDTPIIKPRKIILWLVISGLLGGIVYSIKEFISVEFAIGAIVFILVTIAFFFLEIKISKKFKISQIHELPPMDYSIRIRSGIPSNFKKNIAELVPLFSNKKIETSDLNIIESINHYCKNPWVIKPFFSNKKSDENFLILINTSTGVYLIDFYHYLFTEISNFSSSISVDVFFFQNDIRLATKDNRHLEISNFDDLDATLIIIDNQLTIYDKINGSIYTWFHHFRTFFKNTFVFTNFPKASKIPNFSNNIYMKSFSIDEVLITVLGSPKHLQPTSKKLIYSPDLTTLRKHYNPLFIWICCLAIPNKLSWQLIILIGIELEKVYGNFIDLQALYFIATNSWLQKKTLQKNREELTQEIPLETRLLITSRLVEIYDSQIPPSENSHAYDKFMEEIHTLLKYQRKDKSILKKNQSRSILVDVKPLDIKFNKILKRTFDIVFSVLVLLFVCSWLFPLIALAIKFTSSGPVLFKQKRTGLNNSIFYCWKFRTMYIKVHYGKEPRIDDPRITPIGAFLRKTSLDELPQFINVLIGNMSVVGPRPHAVQLNETFSPMIRKFDYRHSVKPGITGLAQSKGYRGETSTFEMMNNRVRLDLFYVKKWTLLLDLKIVLRTIISLMRGDENAY